MMVDSEYAEATLLWSDEEWEANHVPPGHGLILLWHYPDQEGVTRTIKACTRCRTRIPYQDLKIVHRCAADYTNSNPGRGEAASPSCNGVPESRH